MENARQKKKDHAYLASAAEISRISRDPNTQVGAIIVGVDGNPVSWGYNGTFQGFPDEEFPWTREPTGVPLQINIQVPGKDAAFAFPVIPFTKYDGMEHAERNAIDFTSDRQKLSGSTIYVTQFPCESCARAIAKAGISRVVVSQDANLDSGTVKLDVPQGTGSTITQDIGKQLVIFGMKKVTIEFRNATIRPMWQSRE
jgi:dCMP deaminase